MGTILKGLALSFILFGVPAFGDDEPTDSNTDGFVSKLRNAQGLVLRVSTDENGRENAASTEIRLHAKSGHYATEENLAAVWSEAESLANEPVLPENSDVIDASTRGWHHYRWNYWVNPYYYYDYQPYYYSYGNYYDWFFRPFYHSFGGYRYYYYPCYLCY